MNICQNENSSLVRMKISVCDKYLKILERVKGIEPSYSAWKSDTSLGFLSQLPTKRRQTRS